MRAAEGGEEVVERVLVGDVDGRQVEIRLVLVRVEDVVLADRDVEQVARRNARRVVVVVLGAGSRNLTSCDVYPAASQEVKPEVGVAATPSQVMPASNC